MKGNRYDTVVVGAGIGGLTSAAYLAQEGRKVVLIEKNSVCGGLVNSFKRDGFHFDAGVRALADAGIILPMLEDLGIKLDIVKSPVSVGIENEVINIKNLSSLNHYKDLLVRFYPDSEEEINDLLKTIRKIMKHMDVLYGLENPVFKDLVNDREFLFKKLLPWLPKFLFTIGKINRMNMPVEKYLKTIVSDSSLRDIISQHFFKNTPTFFALSYFSLYLDYFYPKGGVGKLVDALKNKVLESGGEILLNREIKDISAEEKLVSDSEGRVYYYDTLIWAADLKTLYKSTNTNGLAKGVKSKIEARKLELLEYRGGDSVFTLFVKVDEPIETFRNITNGHFFYTPSKKGLGKIHTEELNKLLRNWSSLKKEEILEWMDRFTKYNTFEISIPGLKDKDLVPEGKTGVIISLLMEYDFFKKAKESNFYVEFKMELEKSILKVLSNSIFPILKDKTLGHFSYTPLSIKDRVASSEGAITGWSFEKPVPAINRIQQVQRSVSTPIPSVYQAGQWAYSPAGVPMSILTGKLAADKIIKRKIK